MYLSPNLVIYSSNNIKIPPQYRHLQMASILKGKYREPVSNRFFKHGFMEGKKSIEQ
jgi:hypothetical protein